MTRAERSARPAGTRLALCGRTLTLVLWHPPTAWVPEQERPTAWDELQGAAAAVTEALDALLEEKREEEK